LPLSLPEIAVSRGFIGIEELWFLSAQVYAHCCPGGNRELSDQIMDYLKR